MSDKKTYQVLGIEGNTVEVNGVEYAARVDTVDLTDEEAAQPLAESKIALVEVGDAPAEAPVEETPDEAPVEDAPAEDTSDEDAPSAEGEGEAAPSESTDGDEPKEDTPAQG